MRSGIVLLTVLAISACDVNPQQEQPPSSPAPAINASNNPDPAIAAIEDAVSEAVRFSIDTPVMAENAAGRARQLIRQYQKDHHQGNSSVQAAARRLENVTSKFPAKSDEMSRSANRTASSTDPETRAREEYEQGNINDLRILSKHWRKGGFESVALWTVTVRNMSTKVQFSDLVYHVEYSGRSGTTLTSRTNTIFDSILPGQTRTFEVNDGFIPDQAAGAELRLISATKYVRLKGKWVGYRIRP